MWRRRAGAGAIGYIATAAGAFKASDPSDTLIDTIYALKAGHRQNASFVMNRKTQAEIRKFKDADGNYLWHPPAAAGQQASRSPSRRHAGYRRQQHLDRLRQFCPRLSRRRSDRGSGAARSLFRQALCTVLYDQARRRRSAKFRGYQARRIRGILKKRKTALFQKGCRSFAPAVFPAAWREEGRGSPPAASVHFPALRAFPFSPSHENARSFYFHAMPDGKSLRPFPGMALDGDFHDHHRSDAARRRAADAC